VVDLGTIVTIQLIHVEIKGHLNWVFLANILPSHFACMALHGSETWCLTLREEHILRLSENNVQRRIVGPRRDEETGGWRRLFK
jgi:hypothetical protein